MLLPNTHRLLFAADFMIYFESSNTRSDLIQSNLQTSMADLILFNSDHRIILSCTKSVWVLFERKKSNMLKPQDVTYNGQVIPSSSSDKFLGITLNSHLPISHPHCRHPCPSSPIKIELYLLLNLWPHYIRSLFDYGAPATCVASPNI